MQRKFEGHPGEYPYELGIYSGMYTNRPWKTMQYSGFGTVQQTNRNFHKILSAGTNGISIAFDLPSQMGISKYSEMGGLETGKVGVSVETLDDMRLLLDGIQLSEVNISMTINSTAAMMLLMLQIIAEEQDVDPNSIKATIQNDLLKEYISRNTFIFAPNQAMRLTLDIFEYCQNELPNVNPISVSGYHMEEAGATAAQEIGFAISNGIEYLRLAQKRDVDLEKLAERFTFFFSSKTNFVEEICKFRAARVLWARLLVEKFGFTKQKALKMRIHAQTAGSELTAIQPENNFARVTIQALAAVLGGVQSLHTNSYNEAHSLPTQYSSNIAINTQKIIWHETDISEYPDLLKGAEEFERKTELLVSEALEIFVDIENRGGALKAVESNYQKEEIERNSYLTQMKFQNGSKVVVGLNEDGILASNVVQGDLYFDSYEDKGTETIEEPSPCEREIELEARLTEAWAGAVNVLYPIKQLLIRGYSVPAICELLKDM
jgi:methylmalonyl-CoA mutase N-terminal domain/subunit